jgi:magnesium-transporting ATPase (P-type)
MIDLIKECRAGLSVNFSYFNLMACYSLILYSSSTILFYYYSQMTQYKVLYINVFHNFVFFLSIGYSDTPDILTSARPSESIFGVSNLVGVFISVIIQLLGHLTILYSMQNNFFANMIQYWTFGGLENNKKYFEQFHTFSIHTPEVQALFLFGNFMYIATIITACSSQWKKPFYTNWIFTFLLVIIFIYDILICVYPQSRL